MPWGLKRYYGTGSLHSSHGGAIDGNLSGGGLAESWERGGEKPHPSTSLRAGFLAKNARNGAPG